MPEEEAFCLLVRMMRRYRLRSNFTSQMEGLQQRLFIFDRLLQAHLPALHAHLNSEGVRPTMYASAWILTFFAYRFPMALVTRVFDLILFQGADAIYKFSIAVLKRQEEKLMTMEFESLLETLKSGGIYEGWLEDPFAFVTEALTVRVKSVWVKRWGKEWDRAQQLQMFGVLASSPSLEIHNPNPLASQRKASHAECSQNSDSLKIQNGNLQHQLSHLESTFIDLNHEYSQLAKELVVTQLRCNSLRTANDCLENQVKKLKDILESEKVKEICSCGARISREPLIQ